MKRPDLKAIRERCEKATRGPWEISELNLEWAWVAGIKRWRPKRYDKDGLDTMSNKPEYISIEDAQFISNARNNDIPNLLDYTEKLEEAVRDAKLIAAGNGAFSGKGIELTKDWLEKYGELFK